MPTEISIKPKRLELQPEPHWLRDVYAALIRGARSWWVVRDLVTAIGDEAQDGRLTQVEMSELLAVARERRKELE